MIASYDWMRATLIALFDDVTTEAAVESLRDPATRTQLRARLNQRLTTSGEGSIPAGDRGDNLLQAMLALRVKFPRDEAIAKLEINISMRERQHPPA
jgi:hypothetical protein